MTGQAKTALTLSPTTLPRKAANFCVVVGLYSRWVQNHAVTNLCHNPRMKCVYEFVVVFLTVNTESKPTFAKVSSDSLLIQSTQILQARINYSISYIRFRLVVYFQQDISVWQSFSILYQTVFLYPSNLQKVEFIENLLQNCETNTINLLVIR